MNTRRLSIGREDVRMETRGPIDARRRVCRSCETAIWTKPLKSDFRTAREWRRRIRVDEKLRAHWLVRFRPRLKVQDEMWRLNIPVACAAVRGEFGKGVLGEAFDQCVALVSLMLRGSGSVDLVLLAKSGDVAIGECKLRDQRNDPEVQLKRYRRGLIATARSGRLWQEIERSYGRYEFQHLCDTVRRHFALADVATWCGHVQRNASDQNRIKTFVVRGIEVRAVRAAISVAGRTRREIAV